MRIRTILSLLHLRRGGPKAELRDTEEMHVSDRSMTDGRKPRLLKNADIFEVLVWENLILGADAVEMKVLRVGDSIFARAWVDVV